MKPTLCRENGEWACWGGIFSRCGSTPVAAYESWRQTWNENPLRYAPSRYVA